MYTVYTVNANEYTVCAEGQLKSELFRLTSADPKFCTVHPENDHHDDAWPNTTQRTALNIQNRLFL